MICQFCKTVHLPWIKSKEAFSLEHSDCRLNAEIERLKHIHEVEVDDLLWEVFALEGELERLNKIKQ